MLETIALWVEKQRLAEIWEKRRRARTCTALMVGGPLDGEIHQIEGDRYDARVLDALPPLHELLGAKPRNISIPPARFVRYVRTREFMKVHGPRVWIMQPEGDTPVSDVFRDLPHALRASIGRALA